MKTYKCVKSWKRHEIGTTLNEWEYTKLPINIKANHFREIEYVGASTAYTNIASPPITTSTPIPVPQTTVWMESDTPIGLNIPQNDGGKTVFSTANRSVVREVNVNSVGPDFGNTPLTTFTSGNKFKDKLRPKVENDIRPTE